jgi:hypothetical protein
LWAPQALMVAVIAVKDALPLVSKLLAEPVSPELLHLQIKLAAQLPYRQAAALLEERAATFAVVRVLDPHAKRQL